MPKERRQQTESREYVSEDLRAKIQYKSSDRCVWCGKKVFLGYEGTVDHFIPLKKGGTNDEVNLVLMCHDCNQKKGSRIFPINVAATYLNEEYQKELSSYFENYVNTYDYISRGNLMASDVYEMFFLPQVVKKAEDKARKKGKKLNLNLQRSKYLLKRAYPDDQEKITNYYIKYLKKYDILKSEEAALENIKFWMRFGSIYFIEKNNEVAVIASVVVNKHGYISFDVFAYYSTMIAWKMSTGIVECLGEAIMEENNLGYLPLSLNRITKDELASYVIPGEIKAVSDGRMVCSIGFMIDSDKFEFNNEEVLEENMTNFADFIHRFDDRIEDDILMYLYQNDLMDYSWMADEILDRNFFDEKCYRTIKKHT